MEDGGVAALLVRGSEELRSRGEIGKFDCGTNRGANAAVVRWRAEINAFAPLAREPGRAADEAVAYGVAEPLDFDVLYFEPPHEAAIRFGAGIRIGGLLKRGEDNEGLVGGFLAPAQ